MSEICLVLCTAPEHSVAQKIAEYLVTNKLAACVNILPSVTSVYAWEGELHIDKECQMVIKTTEQTVNMAQQAVANIHPYDVPEWLVINDITGSQHYLTWLRQQTTI